MSFPLTVCVVSSEDDTDCLFVTLAQEMLRIIYFALTAYVARMC